MRKNGLDSIKLLKKGDLFLVLVLLIVAVLAFGWLQFSKETGEQVCVTIDGEVYGTYSLKEDQQIEIAQDGWRNVLVIQGGYADMADADCPDQICVDHNQIHNIGETIVCLPHKLVVEIIAKKGDGEEKDFDVIAN